MEDPIEKVARKKMVIPIRKAYGLPEVCAEVISDRGEVEISAMMELFQCVKDDGTFSMCVGWKKRCRMNSRVRWCQV